MVRQIGAVQCGFMGVSRALQWAVSAKRIGVKKQGFNWVSMGGFHQKSCPTADLFLVR
jgi:hypothetical protein